MATCPSCASEVPEGNRFCGSCGTSIETPTSAPTETSLKSQPPATSHPSLDKARFIPGIVLAKRYRIISLLGRGGMGEVYRADDLKLGQPVALKFLPADVQRDRARLDRFLNEVRTALKVTHPNVCRVYDIGEVDGQHYISMEYVDGEDLSSLLRRIGRLPEDKAVQLARHLCAGLAAAHEQGILHRDLKPANVMIDGRGRAKITDFGLASLADMVEADEVLAGTPAYMAPEQLEGKEVTVRSDLYALGLVLYELFTGKRAFDASTPAEMLRLERESTPSSPSSHVEGMDPVVERVILHCLESDPAQRPSSVMAVAAGLPGGDPLAAALAAGETPSPEMVAAAGPQGGLKLGWAVACLVILMVGTLVTWIFSETIWLHAVVPMPKSFDVLREDAREVARSLGYEEPPVDHVAEFRLNGSEWYQIGRLEEPWAGWDALSRPEQVALYFSYRQRARGPLMPTGFWSEVSDSDPPTRAGDITVHLNLQGDLLLFQADPERIQDLPETDEFAAVDWSILFSASGLDPDAFEEVPPRHRPPFFADSRAAWTGVLPGEGARPVRIEVAATAGKPSFFMRIHSNDAEWPREGTEEEEEQETEALDLAFIVLLLLLLAFLVIGAILLVIRNLALGRGDRRGAFRVSLLVFALIFTNWLVAGHHVLDPDEAILVAKASGRAAGFAVLAWLLYITLEPYIRRFWPQAMISWNRLLAGRLADPLVGRDILAGLAISALFPPIWFLVFHFSIKAGLLGPLPASSLPVLQGGRHVLGSLLAAPLLMLFASAALVLFYMLLRVVLRRQWLAVIVYCLLYTSFNAMQFAGMFGSGGLLPGILGGLISSVVLIIILVRLGVVALMASFLFDNLVQAWPLTVDLSSPFFGSSLIGPIVMLALALYAFKVSLAGRPLFSDDASPVK